MGNRTFLALAVASVAALLLFAASGLIQAAGPPGTALTGQVRSQAEGLMEGVLVSAKKGGSTITITVVSWSR